MKCLFRISFCSETVVDSTEKVTLSSSIADRELDIIEMAVYGDVMRPGNQCRCRTVAEMLGKYKTKDQMSPCKLPYNDDSLRP